MIRSPCIRFSSEVIIFTNSSILVAKPSTSVSPIPKFSFESDTSSTVLKADTTISQMAELNSLLTLRTPFKYAQPRTRGLKRDTYNHLFIVCSFYGALTSPLPSLLPSGIHIEKVSLWPPGQPSPFPNIWLVSIPKTLNTPLLGLQWSWRRYLYSACRSSNKQPEGLCFLLFMQTWIYATKAGPDRGKHENQADQQAQLKGRSCLPSTPEFQLDCKRTRCKQICRALKARMGCPKQGRRV